MDVCTSGQCGRVAVTAGLEGQTVDRTSWLNRALWKLARLASAPAFNSGFPIGLSKACTFGALIMTDGETSFAQEGQSSAMASGLATTFNVAIALGSAVPFLFGFEGTASSVVWLLVTQLCTAMIAIAVVWHRPGRYSLFHGGNLGRLDRSSEPDPTLCLAGVWAPPVLTVLLYYSHIEVVQHLPLVLAACVLGAFLFVCAEARDRAVKDEFRPTPAVVGVVFSLLWGYAMALDVNCVLDRSEGVVYKTAVAAKVSPGRGQPYLLLNAWGPEPEGGRKVVVAHEVYNSVEVGGTVCAVLREGSIGARWYTVETCPWNGGPVLFWGSRSR